MSEPTTDESGATPHEQWRQSVIDSSHAEHPAESAPEAVTITDVAPEPEPAADSSTE